MDIGIIIFSYTGHTRRVGELLKRKLSENHNVSFHVLEAQTRINLSAEYVAIKNLPSVESFDLLILGSPVHGGRASGPVNYLLERIVSFNDKPIILYVTHFFKGAWGADQALDKMSELCVGKAGRIVCKEKIKWFSLRRSKNIHKTIESIARAVEII